jgi:small subunit ribosomal protein S3
MGQKIRPNSFRLGVTENWRSRWWPRKNFRNELEEDVEIRKAVHEKASAAGIVRIEIERAAQDVYKVMLKVARPGIVIGRGGKGIEDLSKLVGKRIKALHRLRGIKNPAVSVSLNIEELKRTEASAQYFAQTIAWDLEKRIGARRTMKRYLGFMIQNREVLGAKILLSGRLDGREISRRESLAQGKLPLQSLRANIDYGVATAFNTYGTVGVKVWIYKGDVFEKK